jgi:hypothetical protein
MTTIDDLRRQVAASESRERLHRLLREAEQLGADDLAERISAKVVKLGGKPLLGGPCPQLRQIIGPWTIDSNGIMSRESYSVDAYAAVDPYPAAASVDRVES